MLKPTSSFRSTHLDRLAGAAVFLIVVIAFSAAQAWGHTGRSGKTAAARTTILVTVGKPAELSVKLSKTESIPAGSIAFEVTNRGTVSHTFKICSAAEKTLLNSCTGKSVTVAKPGQMHTLTVTLQKGKYEFLSTAIGQSSLGRKGLIGIALKAPSTTQAIPNTTPVTPTTPTKTTTTPKPTTPKVVFPTGNAANGPGLFSSAGCGGCHVLSAAGSGGESGPNLDQAKPSIIDVESQVYAGGGDMPGFAEQLTLQQIADLAAWVSQVA